MIKQQAFRRIHITISIFIISVSFASCFKTYVEIKISHTLEPFNKVVINSPFNVFLAESDHFDVDVVGDKEMAPYVTFNVVDSILYITNEAKSKWTNPQSNVVEVTIYSKPLEQLAVNVTCNTQTLTPITSNEFGIILGGKANEATLELDCKNFYYWNNFPCGGMLTLTGKTENLKLWNFAIMSINAKELNTTNAIVENNSKGDIKVTVNKRIEYAINGIGNIYLFGSPVEIISTGITSSGQLIIHEE